MMISNYFTQEEVTHSDTALRNGINNEPPKELWPHIFNAAKQLDFVRDALCFPIIVSSWYRCFELEKLINARVIEKWLIRNPTKTVEDYLKNKKHPKGSAIDFTCPRFGSVYDVAKHIEALKSDVRFDQLIYEHTWIHISFCTDTCSVPRLEVLTLEADGTYSVGINKRS